jgi:hypothetical protein
MEKKTRRTGIVLSRDVVLLAHNTIHRRVVTVVVLRRKTEDGETSSLVLRRLRAVMVAEHASDAEFATFDPDRSSVGDGLEEHGAALDAEKGKVSSVTKYIGKGRKRTSAGETTVLGSSGSATGLASGFSLRSASEGDFVSVRQRGKRKTASTNRRICKKMQGQRA